MIEYGYVQDIRAVTDGSYLEGDAALGATKITVEDAGDFIEDGGTIAIWSMDTDGVTLVRTEYDYTGIDFSTETLTLATPLVMAAVDGDRVDVSPLVMSREAVVLLTESMDAITAKVPHQLTDLLAAGIRDEGDQEFVTVELTESQWTLTDVIGKEPVIQSTTYNESDTGWIMDAESTQFENANVLGTVGADAITANSIQIGDQDLVADVLSPLPLGLIAHGAPASGTDTGLVGATETMLFTLNIGQVFANRVYRVTYSGNTVATGPAVDDVYTIRIKYTKDGTQPTTSSEILDRSTTRIDVGTRNTQPNSFTTSFYYLPTLNYPTVILGVAMLRSAGTGSMALQAADANYQFSIFVEDMGMTAPAIVTPLAQKSKATGTPDASAKATYTRTYDAKDSQSYNGDGTKRTDVGKDMYQGKYSSTHGNQRSVATFDYATIQADLAGATILSCKLTYRVKHSYYQQGLDVRVSYHNSSGIPATQAAPGTLIYSRNNCAEGATYTADLGTSFGNNLRDGNYRGIVFYGDTDSQGQYGYMYGYGSGSGPRLVITYQK